MGNGPWYLRLARLADAQLIEAIYPDRRLGLVEAAGGSIADFVKATIFVSDITQRETVGGAWVDCKILPTTGMDMDQSGETCSPRRVAGAPDRPPARPVARGTAAKVRRSQNTLRSGVPGTPCADLEGSVPPASSRTDPQR